MPTYATATDYAAFLGVPDDYDAAERARINAGLLNAQDDVDGQIYFGRYDPASADVVTALTRATCARFQFAEAVGDDGVGAAQAFDSVRVGPVSLSRSTDSDTVSSDVVTLALGPRAATILRNAGLITNIVSHS